MLQDLNLNKNNEIIYVRDMDPRVLEFGLISIDYFFVYLSDVEKYLTKAYSPIYFTMGYLPDGVVEQVVGIENTLMNLVGYIKKNLKITTGYDFESYKIIEFEDRYLWSDVFNKLPEKENCDLVICMDIGPMGVVAKAITKTVDEHFFFNSIFLAREPENKIWFRENRNNLSSSDVEFLESYYSKLDEGWDKIDIINKLTEA